MMRTTVFTIAAAALLAFAAAAFGADPSDVEIDALVVDHADVLSPAAAERLERNIEQHYQDTGVDIAVLTVDTTDGVPIQMFSIEVAERWGGGAEDRDDGILYVMAVDDRNHRIEVGYGLEHKITDARARAILDSVTRQLRVGDYDRAAERVVDQLIAQSGDGVGAAVSRSVGGLKNLAFSSWLLILLLFGAIAPPMSLFGYGAARNREGVGGTVIAWLVFLALGIAVPIAIMYLILVSLVGTGGVALLGGIWIGFSCVGIWQNDNDLLYGLGLPLAMVILVVAILSHQFIQEHALGLVAVLMLLWIPAYVIALALVTTDWNEVTLSSIDDKISGAGSSFRRGLEGRSSSRSSSSQSSSSSDGSSSRSSFFGGSSSSGRSSSRSSSSSSSSRSRSSSGSGSFGGGGASSSW